MENNSLVPPEKKELYKQLFRDEQLAEKWRDRFLRYNELMAYYRCAIMEITTKFNVLNEEFSLLYDRNPISSVKSRLKSIVTLIERKSAASCIGCMEFYGIACVHTCYVITEFNANR